MNEFLNEREKIIIELLMERPRLSISEISRHLNVSTVTVRGDFDSLAEKGLLIRTRGGAVPAFHPEITARQKHRPDVKARIARKAASFVEDGDTLMIEAGTTTALIGRYLFGKRDIRIVTDSTLILPYSRSNPSIHVTLIGGEFHPEAESLAGVAAVRQLEQYHVKTAFLGTDGFSGEGGVSSHIMEAVEIVRTMHRCSERTVLLADSSKWGQSGFARILPLEEIDVLVTDSDFPEEAYNLVRDMEIEIHVA